MLCQGDPLPPSHRADPHTALHTPWTQTSLHSTYMELERGNKKCTQQYLCMQSLCNAAKYTHTIHPSRRTQRGTIYMHRNMYILKIPLRTYLPLQKDNGTKPWQMIVNLVLQETPAQFPGFASFEAKFEPFPWGKGVLLRKFFCLSMFIQTGRAGRRVIVGCGRGFIFLCIKWFRAKFEPACHISVL